MTPEMLIALLASLAAEGPLALDTERLARGPGGAREERRGGAVAVVSLMGVLRPRTTETWFGVVKGMDRIRRELDAAAANPEIASILLHIDSPGGTVAGTPETAAAVAAAAARKPVVAFADGLAASAAYWIGSQATEFVASPSADVGSIGVISVHQSVAKLYERMGVDTTVIRAGKFKGEGNSFEPLGEEAQAAMQARVDAAYGDFLAAVAAGRKASEKRVREGFGEGRVLDAKAALAEGMIDRVATLDETIAGLAAGKGRAWSPRRRSAIAYL